jgi:hypothetical protein
MESINPSILKNYPITHRSLTGATKQVKKERILALFILIAILWPLDIIASMVAFETAGEVASYYLIMGCIFINFIGFLCLLLHFWSSVVVMVIFQLMLIGGQIFLAFRMHYVKAEAANIVSWVYSEKVKTGSYPKDLSNYVFLRPEYKKYIQDYGSSDNNFAILYYITSRNVSHHYDSEEGWGYYPD